MLGSKKLKYSVCKLLLILELSYGRFILITDCMMIDPNKAYLTYPETDYSILPRFPADSSQHQKQSLEKQEVQDK